MEPAHPPTGPVASRKPPVMNREPVESGNDPYARYFLEPLPTPSAAEPTKRSPLNALATVTTSGI